MDTHKLRITVSNMKNANTVAQLQSMRDTVLQNLSQLPPAPSVPFTRPPPKFQVVSPSSTSVQCLCPRLLVVLQRQNGGIKVVYRHNRPALPC